MNTDLVIAELRRATNAALDLCSTLRAARQDDDEWTRYPTRHARCPVSGWSRSKIDRFCREGRVRRKTVGTSAFYSAADVRRIIFDTP